MAFSINDGLQAILDAINNLIEPKLNNLKYDKTYRAKVISNDGDGKYTVQINGNNYTISTTVSLNIGQVIKVKAPLNNFSDIYMEGGTSGGSGSDYNTLINKPLLNTTNSNALETSSNETIINTIQLHKVSKTGNYNDLSNLPVILTKTSQLNNDGSDGVSPYANQLYVDNKVSAVYKYKGSVATYNNLPTTGNIIGDVWNVNDTGKNYAWTGSLWDDLGGTVDLSNYYTKDQTFSQDQVNNLLISKAPLESPVFTGIPKAPTATSGTSTTQLATTAFVEGEIVNNVTSINSLATNEIITGTGLNRGVKSSGTTISTTLNPVNDNNVPTSKAVATYLLGASVSSVNGKTGNVLLTTDDIPATITNRYVPAIPENDSDTKFLNGDGVFTNISVGGASSIANVFFSNTNSSVTGYKTLNYIADTTQTEIAVTVDSSADVLSATYLYESPINTTIVDAGIWQSNIYMKCSHSNGTNKLKIVCFVRHADNTETDLFTKYTLSVNSTDYSTYYTETNRPSFSVATTDRMGFRVYGNTTITSPTVITYVIGGTNASYLKTPLTLRHTQLRDKNGEADYQHMSSAEKDKLASLSKYTLPIATASALGGIKVGDGLEIGADGRLKATGVQMNPYPVGSLYISVNSTNPSSLFGGTWVQIKDTFLIAAGDSYTGGTIGGSATHSHTNPNTGTWSGTSDAWNGTSGAWSGTSGGWSGTSGGWSGTTGSHTLTIAEIPSHNHPQQDYTYHGGGSQMASGSGQWFSQSNDSHTKATGGGGGHTHTLPNHTHDIPNHTHNIPSHTHTLPSHAHTLPSHTHTIGNTSTESNIPPYLAVFIFKRTE